MKNNLKIFIVIIILIIIGAVIYYQKTPTVVEPVDTGTQVVTEDSSIGCYVATLGKDVYSLSIATQQGENVEGTLVFKNFEKDSSSGTFKGTYKNGILLGDYTFQSEGMTSVMQVIFKKSGADFIRGYGDLNADGTRFTDLNAITYDTQAVFKKTTDVCAKPQAATAPTSTVGVGETRTIEGVSVKVNKMVTDSRCPTDVTCIQAGSVTMNVTLKSGTTTKTVDLTSGKAPYIFAGYKVSIGNVTPVRISTVTPNASSYQTTFVITK